jgi:hypothetical protein
MNQVTDFSPHVVEINRLTRDLNELIRQTHKPDLDAIEIVCHDLEHQVRMCMALIDWVRIEHA